MKTPAKNPKREIKDHVVALKLDGTLVDALDREAMAEGLTRSAVIRRTLMEKHVTRKRVA